jgi:hypothetical protein
MQVNKQVKESRVFGPHPAPTQAVVHKDGRLLVASAPLRSGILAFSVPSYHPLGFVGKSATHPPQDFPTGHLSGDIFGPDDFESGAARMMALI